MKNTLGGFTIVEVMIVLAISAVMLISAATVFNGRRETTNFSQSMYDLRSQIQTIANSVSSQSVPGLQQYTCAPASVNGVMRPVLSPGSSTGQDCIYIGQAVQVTPGSASIYSYPVFGLRTVYVGNNDTGQAPATVAQANPEPAISSSDPTNPNNMLLINTYTILNGLQVSSAKWSGSENDILTIYSTLQDSNTSGNEISVSSFAYTGGSTDAKTQIKQCVEGSGCAATGNSTNNTAWKLCVTDTRRSAEIDVKSTSTGITTDLNMGGCS